jgi:membrane protein implicated in regulation of membrane protease activity
MMRARLAAAFLGLALAIAAIATGDRRLAWAAIAALSVALTIRLILRRRSR